MELQVLTLVTFFAAAVNGAVGYGFSSLTVPIALLFFSNKVLNPALVIVAIALNGYVLAVNRRSVPVVAKRVNNQGLVQRDFRAAMALLRVAEAVLALLTYYALGLFNAESLELSFWVLPSVLLGVPIGSFLINRVDAETFRRICMSYDAWIVGFGLSRVLIVLQLITTPAAYTVWLAIAAIDSYLLYAFFTRRKISQAPA